ncbi:ABC transporter substrate-binding protein [Microbacteriaceae bacterium K1510]|nr:ABC transporter substrate-binding protein [Microbacteriaceae bacterium K1510]
MKWILAAAVAAALSGVAVAAEDPIKIGFVSTVSGPQGITGQEQVDGFKLALKHLGGKIGGRPVMIVYGDDQAKPDVGRQVVDKMIDSDRVQIVTGIVYSNVLLAVIKPVLDSGAFYISTNAGPSQLAGKQCHPRFFGVSHQNDMVIEGIGIHMQEKGYKNVYLLAPNYPAGKDMLNGFKRYFKGAIAGEVYTPFGQIDYSAEIAQIRAAKPDAVMFFYPGGMGINFIKQYTQAGLKSQIPLFTGSHGVDQTILPGAGDAALGVIGGALWSEFLDTPLNKKFVADYEADYGRIPSPYAAMAYDTARLIDAAATAVNGKIEDKEAFRKALETVRFESVRGNFRFNKNHFPVMNYYLTVVEKDDRGRLVNAYKGTVARDLADAYAGDCQMAAR